MQLKLNGKTRIYCMKCGEYKRGLPMIYTHIRVEFLEVCGSGGGGGADVDDDYGEKPVSQQSDIIFYFLHSF